MIKEKIISRMYQQAFVTIEDLLDDIPEMHGHEAWEYKDKNILIWPRLNGGAIYAMNQLIKDGRISVRHDQKVSNRYKRKPAYPKCHYILGRYATKH